MPYRMGIKNIDFNSAYFLPVSISAMQCKMNGYKANERIIAETGQ
jgi:C4-type Zn-finger protein